MNSFQKILLISLVLIVCVPVMSKPFFSWVNKPLVLSKGFNRASVSGYAAFGSASGRGGGLGDTDLGFEPHGVMIKHGFGLAEIGLGYSAFFSTDRSDLAPFIPNWPSEMSGSHSYFGVIGVLGAFRLTDWLAIRTDLLIPTTDLKNNGVGTVVSLPFRWVLSPGLLEIHLEPSLFMGLGNKNGKYEVFMTRLGVGFSLLPEMLLRQDLVFTADFNPNNGRTWSTVTSLGWMFSHGVDMLIRYTYKAIKSSRHAQYVSMGFGIDF